MNLNREASKAESPDVESAWSIMFEVRSYDKKLHILTELLSSLDKVLEPVLDSEVNSNEDNWLEPISNTGLATDLRSLNIRFSSRLSELEDLIKRVDI